MAIKRYPDWPARLQTEIERAARAPFRWGIDDCCLFPADCVRAMTGVDVGAEFRGKYDDLAGAAALIRLDGGVLEMIDRLAREFGAERIEGAFATRGDVVLADPKARACLGVVGLEGRHVWLKAESGLLPGIIPKAAAAWRFAGL